MHSNQELFQILIEKGFSEGDTSVFDQHTSKDFVEHQHGFKTPDVEGVKKAINSLHTAFPDLSLTIEALASADDTIWGRMTGRGTHMAQFGPMPATGKTFEITVIDIMRFKDEQLVEHWGVPDRLSLMEQLGMKPPPKLIMKLIAFLNRKK